MPLLVRALSVALLAAAWLQPATHRYRVYSNPSIEISGITQDKDGAMWLAASDGLYRFDGLHFQKITTFPFSSARLLTVTTDGALWIGSVHGLVRYHQGKFEIRHQIEVKGLAAVGGRLYASAERLWEFGPSGAGTQHRVFNPNADLFADPSGVLWYACETGTAVCRAETRPSLPKLPEFILLPDHKDQAVVDSLGRLWAASATMATAYVNKKPAFEFTRQASRTIWRPGPLVPGRNGQLWFLGETVHGVLPEITYSRQSKGVPTAGFEDLRGHLWVASYGEGLVEWIGDSKWERWSSNDFGRQSVAQVAKDERGNVFAASGAGLRRLDRRNDEWKIVRQGGYTAVFPFAAGELLADTVEGGLARITTDGVELERVAASRLQHPSRIGFEPDWIRFMVRDRSGQLWLTSRKGLFLLEGASRTLCLNRQILPAGNWKVPRAIDVEVNSENRLWIANHRGIFWRDGAENWQPLVTEPPLLRLQSFALGKNPNDDIWVSYDTPGRFSRVHRDDGRWIVTDFLPSQGYGPAETHFIRRDSRGWIWRASSSGLHVCDGRNTSPGDWILLSEYNGLTSAAPQQFGFLEDTDGSVWIAGEEGVSHVYPDPSWFRIPPTAAKPRITRVELNGREIPVSELERNKLPAAVNLLRIEIGSFEAAPHHEYPFRYRVLPQFSDWRLSRDGIVELDQPAQDSYRLEVAYSGSGLSPLLSQEFQVGTSVGVVLSWRWGIAFLLLAGTLFTGYRTDWFEKAYYRVSKRLYLRKLEHGQSLEDEPVPLRPAGQVLENKYEIVKLVSRGGFSALYAGRVLNGAKSHVAIKILRVEGTNQGWVRGRFAHEVAALRSVDHPGVVPVLDWWISDLGEPCLVMPFLEGPTLRSALEGGPLPRPRVARLIRQLGAALSEVHARGIVHRDLKPENIMLARAGSPAEQAVIIDFGTAGLRGPEGQLAVTTILAGSLRYMAPEQLTGHYSPTADIYSLGAITLELLTGLGLFNLASHYASDTFTVELEGALRRVVDTATACRLTSVLSPAFSPHPEKRPPNAAAWASELSDIVDQV